MHATIFSGKKSQIASRKIVFYIIAAIVISIAFLLLVLIIPSKKSEIAIIPDGLENYLLTQRFFNSPSCFAFAFQDEKTSRAYPWIIDLAKFNQNNLNDCYDANNKDVKAYRLTLSYEKSPTGPIVPQQLGQPDANGIYKYTAPGATPIWYQHIGNGNWQWTPYDPYSSLKCWMPVATATVSTICGGKWDGQKPVQANIDIINYLNENKPIPATEPADEKIIISTKNWEGPLEKAETFDVFVYDAGAIQKAKLKIEVQDAK